MNMLFFFFHWDLSMDVWTLVFRGMVIFFFKSGIDRLLAKWMWDATRFWVSEIMGYWWGGQLWQYGSQKRSKLLTCHFWKGTSNYYSTMVAHMITHGWVASTVVASWALRWPSNYFEYTKVVSPTTKLLGTCDRG
jgi:hypothetical protein